MLNENINRIIALDVGDARIGVAITDPFGNFAQPHKSIRNLGRRTFHEILKLLQKFNASELIIGLPIELDGNHGPQAEKVKNFANTLSNHIRSNKDVKNCRIIFWDERFSSTQADKALVGSRLKNSDRKAARDRISAAIILESYLNSRV